MITISEHACVTDYEHVEKMIDRICWGFYQRYGGDLDEMKSAANEAFLEARHRYDLDKGAFTTYVWHWVRGYLLKQNNARMKWISRMKQIDSVEASDELNSRSSFVHLLDLSEDADTVIRILFNVMELKGFQEAGNVRTWIRVQLVQRLGWTAERIKESFGEIREALG